jgi:NAD+ synthetase
LKIALAQINTTVAALEENVAKIKDFGSRAVSMGADLVVFPELSVMGYPPRDFLESAEFNNRTRKATEELTRSSGQWVSGAGAVIGTVLSKSGGGVRGLSNVALLVKDGRVLSTYEKVLLPSYDVFDEMRYFDSAPDSSPVSYGGKTVGLTICEDIWNDKDFWMEERIYTRDPVAEMAKQGMEVLLNISASPYALGKPKLREKMLGNLAAKYKIPAVMVNMVGGNDSLVFDGGSMAFDAGGRLLARAHSCEEDLIVVDLEGPPGKTRPASSTSEEEMMRVLTLGLRDYVGKCGFKSVVVGLSGGIDSAVTAVVAARSLGPENVYGVYMPSQYSSKESGDDAKSLASNLGVHYYVIPIEKITEAAAKTLSGEFAGLAEDVTEENIQARVRGMILMALSNKFGHLVLATGNKSEIAAGYCTLYGDMVGGLGVLADIPKTKVYSLARFINMDSEVIPKRTVARQPTAELKAGQKDQDDLPPYETLDAILAAYIEERKGLEEIVSMGFDKDVVVDVMRRVLGAEYKRRQGATILKVTWKAFGEGRRFPIAHGYRIE